MSELDLRAEMFELLGALTNQAITRQQYQRLEHLLAKSKQAREIYLDYLDLDFELREMHADPDVPEALLALKHLTEQEPTNTRPRVEKGRQWLRYAAVAAATLCASLLAQVGLAPHGTPPGRPADVPERSASATEQLAYVATLAKTADCVWEGDETVLPEGWRLAPGRVHLRQGVAQIRFDGGIELVVEGPCVLDIETGRSAALVRGKVVLHGDDISEQFALGVASATFVDLGTEYAVEVDAKGVAEVHVFDGIVVKASTEGNVAEQLAAGRARRYAPGPESDGTDVPLARERFVREVPSPTSTQADARQGLLAFETFDYSATKLPSAEAGNGGIGWAEPWRAAENRPGMALTPNQSLPTETLGGTQQGGSIDQLGDGQIRRRLATPLRLDTNGVYFVSYLFNSPGEEGSDKLRLSLCSSRATLPSEGWMRLHFGKYKSDDVFGYLAGRRFTARLPLDKESTYLLVAKIVASRQGPDQTFATVYRTDEPIDSEEPASWSLVSPPVDSDLVLDEVWVSMIGNVRQRLDDIRIGSTWISVTQTLSAQPNDQ